MPKLSPKAEKKLAKVAISEEVNPWLILTARILARAINSQLDKLLKVSNTNFTSYIEYEIK